MATPAGSIAIYRQAAGGQNFNSATPTNFPYDTVVRQDGDFNRVSNTVVPLPVTGPYLVIHNQAFDSVSANRSEMRHQLFYNGAVLPGVRGQRSTYMRRTGGHNETFGLGAAFVDCAVAGDTIETRVSRTDSNLGATCSVTANTSGMQILKLPDDALFGWYRGSGSVNFTSNATPAALTIDTTDRQDTGFSRAGNAITLEANSAYLALSVSVWNSTANLRCTPGHYLDLNGSAWPTSHATEYYRNANGCNDPVAANLCLIITGAGTPVLTPQGIVNQTDTGGISINCVGFDLQLWKIPAAVDLALIETALGFTTSTTAAALNTLDDTAGVSRVDAGSYAFNSASPSQLQMTAAGDYLVLGAAFTQRMVLNTARSSPMVRPRLGGLTQPGYGLNGGFIRGDQSTNDTTQTANTCALMTAMTALEVAEIMVVDTSSNQQDEVVAGKSGIMAVRLDQLAGAAPSIRSVTGAVTLGFSSAGTTMARIAGGGGGSVSDKAVVSRHSTPGSTGNADWTTGDLGGATPQALMLLQSNAATEGVTANSLAWGIGFSDGLSDVSHNGLAQGGGGAFVHIKSATANQLVYQFNPAASSSSTDTDATINSFIADGSRLNFTDLPNGAAQLYTALHFAGLTNVKVDTVALSNSSVDYTSMGFQADLVLGSFNFQGDGGASPVTSSYLSFGAYDGTNQASLTAGSAFISGYNLSVMKVGDSTFIDYMLTQGISAGSVGQIVASSMDANGLTLTPSGESAGGAGAHFLGLKFTGARVAVGNFDAPSATGNWNFSGLSWKPQFVMLCLANATVSGSWSAVGEFSCCFGFMNEAAQYCNSFRSQEGASPINSAARSDAKALYLTNETGTVLLEGDLVSFNNDGWTINITAANGTAYKGFYVAIEGGSAGGASHAIAGDSPLAAVPSGNSNRGSALAGVLPLDLAVTAGLSRGHGHSGNVPLAWLTAGLTGLGRGFAGAGPLSLSGAAETSRGQDAAGEVTAAVGFSGQSALARGLAGLLNLDWMSAGALTYSSSQALTGAVSLEVDPAASLSLGRGLSGAVGMILAGTAATDHARHPAFVGDGTVAWAADAVLVLDRVQTQAITGDVSWGLIGTANLGFARHHRIGGALPIVLQGAGTGIFGRHPTLAGLVPLSLDSAASYSGGRALLGQGIVLLTPSGEGDFRRHPVMTGDPAWTLLVLANVVGPGAGIVRDLLSAEGFLRVTLSPTGRVLRVETVPALMAPDAAVTGVSASRKAAEGRYDLDEEAEGGL